MSRLQIKQTSSEKNESHSAAKSALIQKLMQDIQHQDNYEAIWEKIEVRMVSLI